MWRGHSAPAVVGVELGVEGFKFVAEPLLDAVFELHLIRIALILLRDQLHHVLLELGAELMRVAALEEQLGSCRLRALEAKEGLGGVTQQAQFKVSSSVTQLSLLTPYQVRRQLEAAPAVGVDLPRSIGSLHQLLELWLGEDHLHRLRTRAGSTHDRNNCDKALRVQF